MSTPWTNCPAVSVHTIWWTTVPQSLLTHSQTLIVAGYTVCWSWKWPSSCCLDSSTPTNRQRSVAICANDVLTHSLLRNQASKQSTTPTTTVHIHDMFSKTPPPGVNLFQPKTACFSSTALYIPGVGTRLSHEQHTWPAVGICQSMSCLWRGLQAGFMSNLENSNVRLHITGSLVSALARTLFAIHKSHRT